MLDREIHYVERTDSAVYSGNVAGPGPLVQALLLNFMAKPSATYWIIACAGLSVNADSARPMADIYATSGLQDHLISTSIVLADVHSACIMYSEVNGGSAAAKSHSIQAYPPVSADLTVISPTIVAIEQRTEDFANQFGSEKSGTETTYQTWDSITITPAGSGDYLILAYGLCKNANTTDTALIELTDGTTVWGETQIKLKMADDRVPWMCMVKAAGLVADTTYTVKVKCTTGAGYYFGEGSIFAMALDTFDDDQYAELRARGTTASLTPTYVTRQTLNAISVSTAPYLLFSAMTADSSSTGVTCYTRVTEAAVELFNFNNRPVAGSSGAADYVHFKVLRRSLLGADLDYTQDYCRSGGALQTAGVAECAIALLRIRPTLGTVNIKGANIKGANIK